MSMALPMAFYVFHIFLIGVLNFLTRSKFAKERAVKLSYFKTYTGDAPEQMIVLGRHYDNQFQVPMLFMITCLSTYSFQSINLFAIGLAWIFVATRILHSFIHIMKNDVLMRAKVYGLGLLCVVGMWVNILIEMMS